MTLEISHQQDVLNKIINRILPKRTATRPPQAIPLTVEELLKVKSHINEGRLDVNEISIQSGHQGTILSWAALSCQLELIRFLLGEENKQQEHVLKNIDWTTPNGSNVLHFTAVSLGFESCSRLIEQQGIGQAGEETEKRGETAIQLRESSCNISAFQTVLDIEGSIETLHWSPQSFSRSSEVLCELLQAAKKNLEPNNFISFVQQTTTAISNDGKPENKNPAHYAIDFTAAHLSSQQARGRSVRSDEYATAIQRSVMSFFSLLYLAGTDFDTTEGIFRTSTTTYATYGRMTVLEGLDHLRRRLETYASDGKHSQHSRDWLTQFYTSRRRSTQQHMHTQALNLARELPQSSGSVPLPESGSASTFSTTSPSSPSTYGSGEIGISFHCSEQACHVWTFAQPFSTHPSSDSDGSHQQPSPSSLTSLTDEQMRETINPRSTEGGVININPEGLEEPYVECEVRGQGGARIQAAGNSCREARELAFLECRIASAYHPSSCLINYCIGKGMDVLCDTANPGTNRPPPPLTDP